jgi:hypothetical protein
MKIEIIDCPNDSNFNNLVARKVLYIIKIAKAVR